MSSKATNYAHLFSKADFWSLNINHEYLEEVKMRHGVQKPLTNKNDRGALVTVMKNGGLGYSSTQDISEGGLKLAFDKALQWATYFSEMSLLKGITVPFQAHKAEYVASRETPLSLVPLSDRIDLLQQIDRGLRSSPLIVDSQCSLWGIETQTEYINSLGAEIFQKFVKILPLASATANKDSVTQTRSLGGMRAFCRHGGMESIIELGLIDKSRVVAEEAAELVSAPNCPTGAMDLLIDPEQMMLQIHESIGHPLELDRILGDERNYAGTSFVTLDMFGTYQYGSPLLNISFDPTIREEFASYGFDDEGREATKEFLIKDGILKRPLGGTVAQARAGVAGVANARISSWNRPPIDRMANINLEPGTSTFDEMVQSIKKGVYVRSNSSWSIDDSRNKFQFGCEWGQLIENGKLTKVVRNPNYRGISSEFWRNLKMVGNEGTFMVLGTPFCGKGEPNQCIRVGHASPTALFSNVEVFGGE